MPGLLRGVARVAAVSATATATSNAVNRRMAAKNVEAVGNAQQQYVEENAQPAPAMAVSAGTGAGVMVPPSAPAEDMYTQLERIGALKAQGILTEEEFAAEKAKILAAG